MPFQLEYHEAVDRTFPRSISYLPALSAAFLLLLLPVSFAQSTSTSGHASSSSVTSHSSAATSSWSTSRPTHSAPTHNADHRPRRTVYGGVYYPYGVSQDNSSNTNTADSDCQAGGPTVFDRCGSAGANYVPPVSEGPAHASFASQAYNSSAADPADSSAPTTLIFKDGHELEIQNYAVVGQTLYDMTPGHTGKVPLADLDISATQKQNQSSGFQLPPARQN